MARDAQPSGTRGACGADADSRSRGAVAARARHQESREQTAAVAQGCIGLGRVPLATRQPAASVGARALWARECPPAEAGDCGPGSEAPGGFMAPGGLWRDSAGRRPRRLVPEGDGARCQAPSGAHGGHAVTMVYGTTEAAATRADQTL